MMAEAEAGRFRLNLPFTCAELKQVERGNLPRELRRNSKI